MSVLISASDGAPVTVQGQLLSSIDGSEARIMAYVPVRLYWWGWLGQWGCVAVAGLGLGFGRERLAGGELRDSGGRALPMRD